MGIGLFDQRNDADGAGSISTSEALGNDRRSPDSANKRNGKLATIKFRSRILNRDRCGYSLQVREVHLAVIDVANSDERNAAGNIFAGLKNTVGTWSIGEIQLLGSCPRPAYGKLRQLRSIGRGRLFVFATALPI